VNLKSEVDHLVVAAASLDDGVRWCRDTFGFEPTAGGTHPLMATHNRVFRIAIRPVAGAVTADQSALKVLVGYDALVLVRPAAFTGDVVGTRTGKTLTLRNAGNTGQELFEGKQCDAAGKDCRDLPARRLYPGVTWQQTLPFDTPVTYKAGTGGKVRERTF